MNLIPLRCARQRFRYMPDAHLESDDRCDHSIRTLSFHRKYLSQFLVEGEKRYWVHVAIDRFTGEVIDRQVEVVKE
jgi:hypothetical protein